MAQSSGFGEIVKWGAIIFGGYYLYNLFTSNTAVAPVASSTTPATGTITTETLAAAAAAPATSTPATPAPATPDMATQLQAAAASDTNMVNGQMNPDQWNYYRNALFPPVLTGAQFDSAFPDRTVLMTAQGFVAALKGQGLAGLGGRRMRVPVMLNTPRGRVQTWI